MFLLVTGLMIGDPRLDVVRIQGAAGQPETELNEVVALGLQADAIDVQEHEHRLHADALVAVVEGVRSR
jgi:hypothetical protein